MTAKIRALVADDEPIALARMVSLLRDEADVEIVSECANGAQAKRAMSELAPDLVFLDIQMPEIDGMTLAREMHGSTPAVVFVTAFDEYALSAFEVHALDYLLKPFSTERFRAAVGRAREHIMQRRADAGTGRERGRRDRLMIKSNGRIHVLRMTEIDWCEAAGNYVGLHVGAQCHLVRETMTHLESELDARQFVRIHRSAIVNVDRVQEMEPSFNGEYLVILRGGTRLPLSRGYRDALQARLGKSL